MYKMFTHGANYILQNNVIVKLASPRVLVCVRVCGGVIGFYERIAKYP